MISCCKDYEIGTYKMTVVKTLVYKNLEYSRVTLYALETDAYVADGSYHQFAINAIFNTLIYGVANRMHTRFFECFTCTSFSYDQYIYLISIFLH